MTLLPSADEMRAMDAAAIASAVSSLELMERAGRAMAEVLQRRANSRDAWIVCGPGNNGGDGLVVARYLLQAGVRVSALLVSAERHSNDFLAVLARLSEAAAHYPGALRIALVGGGMPPIVPSFLPLCALNEVLQGGRASVIVDAVLGTGSRGEPRGAVREAIELIQQQKRDGIPVIALDIPSGIDPDSGAVNATHVVADGTIHVEFEKRGTLQLPAFDACGWREIVAIGIAPVPGARFRSLDCRTAPEVPSRGAGAHKGSSGRVLVVGGSARFPGAPVLTARAALRVGAGLVTRVVGVGGDGANGSPPEIMHLPLSVSSGVLDHLCVTPIISAAAECNVVVLGPGLGAAPQTASALIETVTELSRIKNLTLVVDADALLPYSKTGLRLPNVVTTPHPGEAARLLCVDVGEVQADRYQAALKLHELLGGVVVLKGHASIVFDGQNGWVNRSGNPILATGGSGDVLSGMVAGLIAQGMSPLHGALAAVYLHGRIGDELRRRMPRCIASDIIEEIPAVLQAER